MCADYTDMSTRQSWPRSAAFPTQGQHLAEAKPLSLGASRKTRGQSKASKAFRGSNPARLSPPLFQDVSVLLYPDKPEFRDGVAFETFNMLELEEDMRVSQARGSGDEMETSQPAVPTLHTAKNAGKTKTAPPKGAMTKRAQLASTSQPQPPTVVPMDGTLDVVVVPAVPAVPVKRKRGRPRAPPRVCKSLL